MRKVLSLVLVLCMALSLCACVSEEDYQAQAQQLQDCQKQLTECQEKLEKYQKYDSIVGPMEEADYEAAGAALQAMIPIPDHSEIEITSDNYQDYFELVEVENWIPDAYGKTETLAICQTLTLKEEYMDRVYQPDDWAVVAAWEYDPVFYNCEFDLENKTYTLGSKNGSWSTKINSGNTVFNGNQFLENSAVVGSGTLSPEYKVIDILENYKLKDVQGTIILLDE